jgi:flagellar biosynthesis/type III secretory pathway protein FliH
VGTSDDREGDDVSDFDPHDPEEAYDRGYHKGYREGYREAMLAFMRAIEDGREGIASHHD